MCPAFASIVVRAGTGNASISTGFLTYLLPWMHLPHILHRAQHPARHRAQHPHHHQHRVMAHPQQPLPFVFQPFPLSVPCHHSLLACHVLSQVATLPVSIQIVPGRNVGAIVLQMVDVWSRHTHGGMLGSQQPCLSPAKLNSPFRIWNQPRTSSLIPVMHPK